jgi:branched-chain amino acid transport system permease protein
MSQVLIAPRQRSGLPAKRIGRWAAAVVIVVALAALPLMPFSNAYLVSVAVRALIFIMLGQAWNIVAGVGGQLSLGHGVFFGVGAYASALLFNDFGLSPWIGIWVGAAVAVLLAVVIGLATMRSRGVYFALATVAISLCFEKVGRYMTDLTGGDAGLAVNYRGTDPWAMQFRAPQAFLWIDLAVVVAYFLFTRWLLHSRFGLRMQAVRDDEEAASASGVNVLAVKLAGLAVSAGMTAVVGTLHVQFYLSIDPGTAFGLFQGIQIQLPALIGGLGTALGPVVGGAVAILLSELTNWGATAYGVEGIDILVYGCVLLLVVLFAPRGIIGLFAGRRGRR